MSDTQGWNDLAELEEKSLVETGDGNNLLLVDGTNVAFRFFNRPIYANYKSEYIRTVSSLAQSYDASRIIACFDIGASTFRKEILPEYKEHRKVERSEEEQERFDAFFSCLRDVTESLPFEHYKFRGIEADDLIAYFVEKYKSEYDHIWIVSSDKDLYQLLDTNVSIFNIFGSGDKREVDLDALNIRFELTPEEFLLSRIIQGDKSDNIPGISGIGEVRAKKLIKEYGTLENLIKALPLKGRAKYIQNLNAGKDTLILNEKLMNLKGYNIDALKASESYEIANKILENI